MKKISVLGATGSIGESTLDVIRQHPDEYQAFALSAHSSIEKLGQQIIEFTPEYAVVVDEFKAAELKSLLGSKLGKTELLAGSEALVEVAQHPDVDMVMAAIVGGAGLASTMAAAKAGKRILLANKESLVMAGELFLNEVKRSNSELLPIDSEHNAIFQSLPNEFSGDLQGSGVSKLLLTASGGPFWQTPLSEFTNITPAQAVAHPNWSMGAKISVDSATMMNKGLELIEASFLFNCPESDIEVLIHPQSVVHSMVEYVDGSVIAQMGLPDMRTPIAYGLAWPKRITSGVGKLKFSELNNLDFYQPDDKRFPALSLARFACKEGKGLPAVLNAANEVAVDAFLSEQIGFKGIINCVEQVLMQHEACEPSNLEELFMLDAQVRQKAQEYLKINSR